MENNMRVLESMSPNVCGTIAVICSVLVLSTTGIIISHLSVAYEIPPLVLAFWRNLFLVMFLGGLLELFYPYLTQVRKRDFIYLGWYGLLLSFFNILWTVSVGINGAGVATVLVCLSGIFTPFLAKFFLGEKLTLMKIIVTIVAFFGALLVTEAHDLSKWTGYAAGLTCGVLSGLCYSTYNLMGREAGNRSLNPWTTLLYTFGFATIFLFLFTLVGKIISPNPEMYSFFHLRCQVGGWGYILLLAVGPTLIGFGLCNLSLALLPVTTVNLTLITEPIFTMIIAYFLLGELLTPLQVAGSFCIMIAVATLYWSEGRKKEDVKYWRVEENITAEVAGI